MVDKFKILASFTAAVMLLGGMLVSGSAGPVPINILWYSGGVVDNSTQQFDSYKGDIDTLNALNTAAQVGGTISSTNSWASITYWDSGSAPGGVFDVLVSVSRIGGWNTAPIYTALNTALSGGGVTLGDRVMVTGQDADWHFLNSGGHHTTFDSSQGFLIDAINWAASGTGMGAVFLANPVATLAAALSGLGAKAGGGDTVIIPAAVASFPINESLTSAGLSNWGTSSHDDWSGWDTTQWTGINMLNSDTSGRAITLVSAPTAGGGTSKIPEPATLMIFALGLAGLGFARRRKVA